MVKRKRGTGQCSLEEKLEGATTDAPEQKVGVPDFSGGSPVLDTVNNSVVFGTRSRTVAGRGPSGTAAEEVTATPREVDVKLAPAPPVAAPSRSSARVSKRNRETSAIAIAAQLEPAKKPATLTATVTTTSSKKTTTTITATFTSTSSKKTTNAVQHHNNLKKQPKTRRSWELWSVDDKDAFFEALCEFGKDFENIQTYIAQRSKKKGVPKNMIKNKEQVRHFYYRTWNKISKYLDLAGAGEDVINYVKKHTLELYGLINYAELRKKIRGCLNERSQQKLNELVFHGSTTVKIKGKRLRIKTPVCRALKRLNNIDSKEPDTPKLPREVLVELRPRTNSAFLQVQSVAQNPRVRSKIPLQRRLSSLVAYLERRWKPHRLKLKEPILASMDQALAAESPPNMRVFLHTDSAMQILLVSSVDNACSTDVCLENHIRIMRQHLKEQEELKAKKRAKREGVKNQASKGLASPPESSPTEVVKCGAFHSVSETPLKPVDDPVISDPEMEVERSLNLLKNMIQSIDDAIDIEPKAVSLVPEVASSEAGKSAAIPLETASVPVEVKMEETETPSTGRASIDLYLSSQAENKNLTLGQFLGLANEEYCEREKQTAEPEVTDLAEEKKSNEAEILKSKQAAVNERIKKGWIREECKTITIGELYLMLGHPESVILEYDFEPVLPKPSNTSDSPAAGSIEQSAPITELASTESATKESTTNEEPKTEAPTEESARTESTTTVSATTESETTESATAESSVNRNEDRLKEIRIRQLTEAMNRLVKVATTYFTDFKAKLNPVPANCKSHSRGSGSSVPQKSGSARGTSRSPGLRNSNAASKTAAKNLDGGNALATGNQSVISDGSQADGLDSEKPETKKSAGSGKDGKEKHTFAKPLRTAPRPLKIAPNIPSASVREQLEKLAAVQRRNQRQRNRRPMVVPRPLLPSLPSLGKQSAMTVVHLLPSGNPITSLSAVIPNSTHGLQKVVLPTAKKVMKVLPSGLNIGPAPGNIVFQQGGLTSSHVMVTNSVVSPVASVVATVPTSVPLVVSNNLALASAGNKLHLINNHSLLGLPATRAGITTTNLSLNTLPLDGKMHQRIGNLCITTGGRLSPPQISIPENSVTSVNPLNPSSSLNSSNSQFHTNLSSLLDIPLNDTGQVISTAQDHLIDFNSNSSLSTMFGLQSPLKGDRSTISPLIRPMGANLDPLVSSRQSTPPLSPNSGTVGNRFKAHSPGLETNWLNGESCDFSLSSLLNTLESPVKNPLPPVSTVDGSTLDTMSRLGPDVDSHLQCLINENSVDYVAKFADLAAQIASTSTENKCI